MKGLLAFVNDVEGWLRRRGVPSEGGMAEELRAAREGVLDRFWRAGLLVDAGGKRGKRIAVDEAADAVWRGDFALALNDPGGASLSHPEMRAALVGRLGEGGRCGEEWRKGLGRMAPSLLVTIVPASSVLAGQEEFGVEEMGAEEARFEAAVRSGERGRVERMLRSLHREEMAAYRQRRALRQCGFCRERFFWQRGKQKDCEECQKLSAWHRYRRRRGYAAEVKRGLREEEGEELALLRDIGYSPKELAEWFGKSKRTVYRWIKKRTLARRAGVSQGHTIRLKTRAKGGSGAFSRVGEKSKERSGFTA
jgi:hypothetical protein